MLWLYETLEKTRYHIQNSIFSQTYVIHYLVLFLKKPLTVSSKKCLSRVARKNTGIAIKDFKISHPSMNFNILRKKFCYKQQKRTSDSWKKGIWVESSDWTRNQKPDMLKKLLSTKINFQAFSFNFSKAYRMRGVWYTSLTFDFP